MSEYRAPTDDMLFVLEHIADLSELASRAGYEHADLETVEGVLEEAARFMEEQLAPLNRKGDEEGLVVENGQIFIPTAFLMRMNDLLKLAGTASLWMKTTAVEVCLGVSA